MTMDDLTQQREKDFAETKEIITSLNNRRKNLTKKNITNHPRKLEITQLENGCIICSSHPRNKTKYVLIKFGKIFENLHRMVYLEKYGKINKDMFICHTCDDDNCVNINHLWEGSYLDNIKDMVNKKRNSFGTRQHSCKLNEEKVLQIRKLHEEGEMVKHKKWDSRLNNSRQFFKRKYPKTELAKMFGVTENAIASAINRITWKSVI